MRITILFVTFSLSLQLNISFNADDNNNYTIYNNGTMSNYFHYIPNIEKRCDCSGIDTYYISYNDNKTLFYLSLNETDLTSIDLSTIKVLLSDEELIDIKQTLAKAQDELLIKDTGFRINSINTDYIDKSGRHKILLEVEPELEKDLKIDNDSLNIAS